jgi:hypothetical protein
MKVRRRENAGRRRRIAFHQIAQSDSGSPRSGMVASTVQVGSGRPIRAIDSQFVNHVWGHDPDTTRRLKFAACRHSAETRRENRRPRVFRRLYGNTDILDHAPPRQHKTGRDGPDLFEDIIMGKQRREQPQDSIFANNPFLDGLFEWMDSPEGQQSIEVRDVLWNLLEDVQLDAKQRKLIWPDAERLDLEQSIERVLKKYPDFPRNEVEEFLLDWIDMGYDPENYSQAQLDELDSLTEQWVADHLRKAKASKNHKRTRHS